MLLHLLTTSKFDSLQLKRAWLNKIPLQTVGYSKIRIRGTYRYILLVNFEFGTPTEIWLYLHLFYDDRFSLFANGCHRLHVSLPQEGRVNR
jgi:hypothetical protein